MTVIELRKKLEALEKGGHQDVSVLIWNAESGLAETVTRVYYEENNGVQLYSDDLEEQEWGGTL